MSKRDEFLRKQKILHLATISKDGNPHIIPVWYLYSGKKIYIGTNTKTEKAKNVKSHKKVSFCVDVGIHAPKIFGVMGKGHARLITNKTKVSKLAEKILMILTVLLKLCLKNTRYGNINEQTLQSYS